MAGMPGAGKTELVASLKEDLPGLVVVEHDQLVEYLPNYKPQAYYRYRASGNVLVTKALKQCFAHNYGFILDGTLASKSSLKNVDQAFKKGYEVHVIYVVQTAKLAWELTQNRKAVQGRPISKEGFLAACNTISSTLKQLLLSHGSHPNLKRFTVINKNGHFDYSNVKIIKGTSPAKRRQISQYLEKQYNTRDLS